MFEASSILSPYFRIVIRKYRRLGVSSRTWATPKVWPIFVPCRGWSSGEPGFAQKLKSVQYRRDPKPFVPSQEPNRDPWHSSNDDGADEKGQHVADNRLHPLVRVDAADGAGRVVTDPKRWREQADAHGQDHHHRVVHLVHADLLGNREQQRTE